MLKTLLFFFSMAAYALPVADIPAKISCEGGVKDFTYDCGELRARDGCQKHTEDFDQCVQEFARKFFRRCSKSIAIAWCKRCEKKPSGCQSLGQKPLRKHAQKSSTK